MASFAEEMKAVASDLVTEFGQDAQIKKQDTGGTYDVNTGTIIGGSDTLTAVKAVVLGKKTDYRDGTLIEREGTSIVVSGIDNIEIKDKIILSGESTEFEIINAFVTKPDGTVIVWEIEALM